MKKTIQIPEGNEFSLFIPFVVFSKSGREDASAALWNDLQVVVHMSNSTANVDCTYSVQAQYVVVSFGNDLKRSSYDVIISGEYERRKVCAPLNNHFAITAWADGNYADFVVGQPIICPTQTIIGQFNTTQDIIDLTEELRAALAAAEAAKEEYEEKVEELSGVAQQGDNPDATNTTILTAIGNISIDTTTLAKQGNNPNTDLSQVASDVTDLGTALNQAAVILAKQGNNVEATLSDTQTAAQNAAAAVKDGNDTAIGVAKEIRGEVGTGSDTAAETGTLFAVVKWVKDKVKSIFNLIGSPATGQPATLFAAIAAGGGGGSADALETEVETGKTAIADAIVQKGGTATATDSLATLASEVQNIPNVTKEFVQTDYVKVWSGIDAMDCLKIIEQYYNPLYPTSQCYALPRGYTQTIPTGADKMIYYNSAGVLTTIDNPSGDYLIGAYGDSPMGFCLLQYEARTISTLTPNSFMAAIAFYNAEITLSSFSSLNNGTIAFDSCTVSFGSAAFQNNSLAAFWMYDSTIANNGAISAANLFYGCTDLKYIYMPTLKSCSATNLFSGCSRVKSISLPDLESLTGQNAFNGCAGVVAIYLPKVKTINSGNMFQGCGMLRELDLPECVTLQTGNTFTSCTNLRKLNVPKMSSFANGNTFNSCPNLIDFIFGANISANLNISTWSPTNALSDSSTSLVDIGETFTSNLEKLLYNVRTHIAANLPDRTGSSALTITFSSAMKTAINNDTATKNAFTNKNYTIA